MKNILITGAFGFIGLHLLTELKKSKPTGAKGVFIKKISISSTMGKSMTIDNST